MEIFVVVSLYISVISSLVPYFTILPHFIQTAQFKVTAWLGFGSRKMFRFLLNFNSRSAGVKQSSAGDNHECDQREESRGLVIVTLGTAW